MGLRGRGTCAATLVLASLMLAPPSHSQTPDSDAVPVGGQAPWSANSIREGFVSTAPSEPRDMAIGELLTIATDTEGFAGHAAKERGIVVFWKGKVPAELTSWAARNPHGQEVEFKEGRFSWREALAASQAIVGNREVYTALLVSHTLIREDGGGIVIHTTAAEVTSEMLSVAERVTGLGDGVSFVTHTEPVVPLVGTRPNDEPPWSGGARLTWFLGGSSWGKCSSGFAVIYQGTGRLLSADHCRGGNQNVYDGSHIQIAPATGVLSKPALDSILIDPTASPATQPSIYWGSWSTSGRSTIKGWGYNTVGDGRTIYTSGATSGTRSGTLVSTTHQFPEFPSITFGKASIVEPPGEPSTINWIVGPGDSGGPVTVGVAGGSQARGIIYGGGRSTLCDPVNPDYGANYCYKDVYFVKIDNLLSAWGASMETG